MKMLEQYEEIEKSAAASRKEDRLRQQALNSLPASDAAPGLTAGGAGRGPSTPDTAGADCMDDSQLEEHGRSARPRRVRKQVQSDSWKNAEWNGLKGSFSTMKCSWHHTEPEEPYVFSTVPVSIKQKSVRYREQSQPRQTTFIDSEGETKQTFDHVGSFDGSVAKEEQARQRAERKRSDEMRRRGGGKKQRRKRLLREHFEQGRFRPGRRGEQMRRQWAERKEAEPGGQQKSGSSAGGAEKHDAMDVDGDGELSRHEIFKSIVVNSRVQSLLSLSPNVERLLSPYNFHRSWSALDESNDGSVSRAEFVSFSMKAESGGVAGSSDDSRARTPMNLEKELDVCLLRMFKELRRMAGGVDPSVELVSEWLCKESKKSDKYRKESGRMSSRQARRIRSKMSSRSFLQHVVGARGRRREERGGERREEKRLVVKAAAAAVTDVVDDNDNDATIPEAVVEEEIEMVDDDDDENNNDENNNDGDRPCDLRDWMEYGWLASDSENTEEMIQTLEREALVVVFRLLDKNGDGVLTRREVLYAIMSNADQLKTKLIGFPELQQAFRPRSVRTLGRSRMSVTTAGSVSR